MTGTSDWVDDPPSEAIADILNVTNADECVHGWSNCVEQCGVQLEYDMSDGMITAWWVPIAYEDRIARQARVIIWDGARTAHDRSTE